MVLCLVYFGCMIYLCISDHYLLILAYKVTKDQYSIMSGIFWLYDIPLYQ